MKRRATVIVLGLVCFTLLSTTWFESKHRCPLCKTQNKFYDIGSYGSYIYSWPSKFQYIYWPLTDKHVLYSCKKCHFSTYMWDFDSVDVSRATQVQEYLKDQKWSKKTSDYLEIPITERLEIAEGVYNILERDNDFWCRFYRVKGYHYEEANDAAKARESRAKALEIATRLRTDPEKAGRLKEFVFVSGSMKYFLGDKEGAREDFNEALALKYKSDDEGRDKNFNEYLDSILKEFLSQ